MNFSIHLIEFDYSWDVLSKITKWDEDTFVFERLHPKELRWTKKDRNIFFNKEKGRAVWMIINDEPIAEILWNIAPVDPLDEIEEKDWPLAPYIWSTSVKKKYQGKGYGTLLKQMLYNHLRNLGHKEVYGHARQGSSWNITEKLGAEYLYAIDNYEGTGEMYYYYKQKL